MTLTRAQQAALQRLVWAAEDGYQPLLATRRPGPPEARTVHPQTALALARKGLVARKWGVVAIGGKRYLGTRLFVTVAGIEAFEKIRSGA